MSKILYIVDNNKNSNYKYNIEEDTIIYHFSINSSSEVTLNLDVSGVNLYYYYNNINYDDNTFKIRLSYLVDGIVPKSSSKCICNQENQIINMNNGKSTICPNLLIDNYDVLSNHAAYIGKFKDEVLFYMMSRGISLDVAYRLLLNGFLINSDSIDLSKIDEFVQEIEKI